MEHQVIYKIAFSITKQSALKNIILKILSFKGSGAIVWKMCFVYSQIQIRSSASI